MDTITSTELRTKTPKVIETLLHGGTIDIVHRSKIVGEIVPKNENVKPFNAKKFLSAAKKLNLPKLSYKERERRYRAHLMEKYGKGLSGH